MKPVTRTSINTYWTARKGHEPSKEIRDLERKIAKNAKQRHILRKEFDRMSDRIWQIKYSVIDQKYYKLDELGTLVYLKFIRKERIKGRGLILYFEKISPYTDHSFCYDRSYDYEAYVLVQAFNENKLTPISKKEYTEQYKRCINYMKYYIP